MRNKMIFILVSIFFTIAFCFVEIVGDDAGLMRIEGGFPEYLERCGEWYFDNSSRVLVNLVIYIFTGCPIIWWAIFMGISAYVMMSALEKLFRGVSPCITNRLIALMVLLFPFNELNSAGWIATMTTYFSPAAFGLMSLVPIKKILNNEKMKKWEMVLYALCLLYGANHEQMMVLLLGCYTVSLAYCVIKKNLYIYHLLMFLLAAGSCVFIMTCPGNARRAEQEGWFPAYGMLDILDKVEIGYTTTTRWLLFSDSNLFFLVMCCLAAFFVWRKYNDKMIRGITMIPVAVIVLFGPLRSITEALYPKLGNLANEIPFWGITNPENRGGDGVFMQFTVMNLVMIIVCIELFLLSESLRELMMYATLCLCAIASRVAMGFSSTIYASGYRTCSVAVLCSIIICTAVFSRGIRKKKTRQMVQKMIVPVLDIGLALGMIHLWYIVFYAYK